MVLAVVEHDGVPLIITGDDGALRSWRPDGTLGEFAVDDAHLGATRALAVVEHDGAPLIVTAGRDGALRRWRLDGTHQANSPLTARTSARSWRWRSSSTTARR